MNLQYKYNKNILIIQINLKYFLYSHINTRINWFQTNQGICSKSSVSGDGETRTLTPLLVPDSNSGVSTFHHTPHKSRIYSSQRDQGNPDEKLTRSAIAVHSLPLSTTWLMDNFLYLWEERDSNPRTLMGADCGM